MLLKRKRESTVGKIEWDKINLRKILSELTSEIVKKNEIPCIGHAIDRLDKLLQTNMRSNTKEAYQKGLLHLLPANIKGAGEIDRFDILKLIGESKFKVEKHVRPCEFFLFELMYPEKFLEAVPQDKRDTVVNKCDVWKELCFREPLFLEREDLKESCNFMLSAVYEKFVSYLMMEFENAGEASGFLDLTEKLIRELLVKAAREQKLPDIWVDQKKMIFRLPVWGIDVLVNQEFSFSDTFQYTMRWVNGNKVFSVRAVEEKVKEMCFGHLLLNLHYLNRHHLKIRNQMID